MRVTFGDISAIVAVGGVLLVPVLIGGAAGSGLEGVAGAGTSDVDVIRADPLGSPGGVRRIRSSGASPARPTLRPAARRARGAGRPTSAPVRGTRTSPDRRAPVDSRGSGPTPLAPTKSATTPSQSAAPPSPPALSPAAAAVPPPPPPQLLPPIPPLPPIAPPPPPPPPIGLPPPPPPIVPLLPPLPPLPPLDPPKLPLP
jgi:hypothetical protein